jgi:hypothetical protein
MSRKKRREPEALPPTIHANVSRSRWTEICNNCAIRFSRLHLKLRRLFRWKEIDHDLSEMEFAYESSLVALVGGQNI